MSPFALNFRRSRIKRFRRIFTRNNKLDVIFLAFAYFALIVDALMRTLPSNSQIAAASRFAAALSLSKPTA